MKIILAQGNPGVQYTDTRHNIGFLLIDLLAKEYNGTFVKKPKFHSEIAEATISDEKVLFVKPSTFYNETGQAARLISDFYKVSSENILVIHDDLALPFGVIRTRIKGSDAGNNGIKSLNAHLGVDYARIRVGIYSEKRDLMQDVDFVLGTLSKHEKNAIPALYESVSKFVNMFASNTFELTKITIPES